MVDKKITDFASIPAVTDTDAVAIVDVSDTSEDVAGSSFKSTVATLIAHYDAFSATLTNKTIDADGTGNSITNIEDADIKSGAEIAVAKLADGAARQLLQTDAAGTGVEWATNIDIPGTLDVTGAAVLDSTLSVGGNLTVVGELIYTAGELAFQKATVFTTTTGNLTFNPTGDIAFQQDIKLTDNIRFAFGNNLDIGMINRSTALAADAEIANLIEGTSNHQGVAANSLIVSNKTDDGDIMMLVSDGGNSLEFLRADADVAALSLGWGMVQIGFGLKVAAITRPAAVSADAASIITALIALGLFTA